MGELVCHDPRPAAARWPWLDADDKEQGDQSSTYVLRRDDSGQLQLQAVIIQGASRDLAEGAANTE